MIENLNTEELFLTADKFFMMVEDKVRKLKISYIDAVIMLSEELQYDVEDLMKFKLINSTLKDRLKMNGMEEGYLKKESQLPI